MQTFIPNSGRLELEIFDNPKVCPKPILTLTVRLQFSEPMDPDDPTSEQRASAVIDDIPTPFGADWRRLEGATLQIAELDQNEWLEGAISYFGYHNPIDLATVTFGAFQDDMIPATLKGAIDFTYEGLSRLGKPEFEWQVDLEYEKSVFETVCAAYRKK